MADDQNIKRIPIKNLRQEEGAHDLASSPDMEPYLDFIKAVIQNHDPSPALEAIGRLPLERRYVWRLASALKWGFADFDSVNVDADKKTLKPEDFAKVMDLLKLRPIQFCIFLKTLVGAEEMQRMMVEAVATARGQS
jgi:hypothetical protein